MKEPKATQVPCTCEEGCFLYNEPVNFVTWYDERIVVEGFFIKKTIRGEKYRCYIADYEDLSLSDRYEKNTKFDGFGRHVIKWDKDEN